MAQIDQEKNVCGIWPLLYFECNGYKDRYDFDLGVSIIRASQDVLHSIFEIVEGFPLPYASNYFNEENIQWLLIVQMTEVTQELPVKDVGIRFQDTIEGYLIKTFLF